MEVCLTDDGHFQTQLFKVPVIWAVVSVCFGFDSSYGVGLCLVTDSCDSKPKISHDLCSCLVEPGM